MPNNIEKYKKDLGELTEKGNMLLMAMQYECYPEKMEEALGKDAKKIIKTFPKFNNGRLA